MHFWEKMLCLMYKYFVIINNFHKILCGIFFYHGSTSYHYTPSNFKKKFFSLHPNIYHYIIVWGLRKESNYLHNQCWQSWVSLLGRHVCVEVLFGANFAGSLFKNPDTYWVIWTLKGVTFNGLSTFLTIG